MPKGIPRDKSVKRRIIHRYKITRGHLERVIRMVEEDKYCIDIVNQSIAVQRALKEIDNLVLKNHLENCVSDSIKKGKNKEAIDEIINVIKKY